MIMLRLVNVLRKVNAKGIMAEGNGNGDGNNGAGKQVPKQLSPFTWKPGQSGNPNGRPKGSATVSSAIRRLLEKRIAEDRHKADEVAEKLFQILMKGEDRDAIKAAIEIRKATEGDKLDITKREPFEVQFEREAALADLAPGSGINRLPSGANGHSDDGA